MTNRVVITGYGVVSAIGNSPEEFWNNLKAGKTGIGPITHFDAEATGISVAAEVKEFPFDKYFQKKMHDAWILSHFMRFMQHLMQWKCLVLQKKILILTVWAVSWLLGLVDLNNHKKIHKQLSLKALVKG